MDEGLRRRLVGAGVLLGAAFLLASLLPGRKPQADAGEVVAYDLRTSRPLGSAGPAPRSGEARVRGVQSAPEAEANGEASPAWHVQVGSFENESNARKVSQKLGGAGLTVAVQAVPVTGKVWYRVRSGPYPDEGAAQAALAAVRRQGYGHAQLVRPSGEGN